MAGQTKITRSMLRDRLWQAVLDPTNDDPRRIVKAIEVLLQTMPESDNQIGRPDRARDYMDALTR